MSEESVALKEEAKSIIIEGSEKRVFTSPFTEHEKIDKHNAKELHSIRQTALKDRDRLDEEMETLHANLASIQFQIHNTQTQLNDLDSIIQIINTSVDE